VLGSLCWRRDEVFFEVARPVRLKATGVTAGTELERPFEMPEFNAKPRQYRKRVDDEPTPVTGDVIALFGIRLRLMAQSTQIGWVTRSSCPQVCASPVLVPGGASQKAQLTSVCCITLPPPSSVSYAAVQPRW